MSDEVTGKDIGDIQPESVYIGANAVTQVYSGSTLIWEA